MNETITKNFSRLKLSLYVLPIALLLVILLFFYVHNAINVTSYVEVQKEWFYYLNAKLGQLPQLQYNLTQMGDAFVFLSLLTVLIIYTPKIWEVLLTASILSAILSKILKFIFAVPRPAAVLDHDTFIIVGKPLISQTNSLPSGHSITIFTVLTVLFFAFMPKKTFNKAQWYVGFLLIGWMLINTRVAIGAHFPLDVIIGGVVGYISGISGIFINNKFPIWKWINLRKYNPFFMVLFAASIVIMISKIEKDNLLIFYFSLISLVCALFLITRKYFKKE